MGYVRLDNTKSIYNNDVWAGDNTQNIYQDTSNYAE